MAEIPFGKRIVHESFFKGLPSATWIEYSIPVPIKERKEALSEIMKCLDLLDTAKTRTITIKVEADKQNKIRLITKQYTVDKE